MSSGEGLYCMMARTAIGVIMAMGMLLCAVNAGAQDRELDSTDIYYRALRNYLTYYDGALTAINLQIDPSTTVNIPDTVDGCAITQVTGPLQVKGREFTYFIIEGAKWKDGGFEIRIVRQLIKRKGRKKFEVVRWSYFPLTVQWDGPGQRYILVAGEPDII